MSHATVPSTPASQGTPQADVTLPVGEHARRVSIYSPMQAFDLIDELTHLSRRSIDKNVFFAPQFLVPAMPRLDERRVRLLVLRDESEAHSRLRLLMPFTVERLGALGGPSVLRVWSHPFGPLGTLPVDGDDPAGTLASLLSTLRRPEFNFPEILVLPDLRIDGPMARTLLEAAREAGLPTASVNAFDRAALQTATSGERVLPSPLARRRRREIQRQRRRLAAFGAVAFEIARDPAAVRMALEDFLVLEASGWKGRQRSALSDDRYRAAFAREAVNGLAALGAVRIYTLRVGAKAVASLVLFIEGGEAFAWKSAYDEAFAATSPGQLLVDEATRALMADPAVKRADSCAMPDHFVMNRFWKERVNVATLVIGLKPGLEEAVEAGAARLAAERRNRNRLRLVRKRLRGLFAFGR